MRWNIRIFVTLKYDVNNKNSLLLVLKGSDGKLIKLAMHDILFNIQAGVLYRI